MIKDHLQTSIGKVPRLEDELKLADHLGTLRVRLGIGRMSYSVDPGLYALGSPDAESPVLVSANYKLSFDRLRSQLVGRDAWILVLDTSGINVWCAAGKGTFGSDELARRIAASKLRELVTHNKLIVPQLGATGVSAHAVKRETGFRVLFGPVCVRDLPAYLDDGCKASPAMREVRFPIRERMVLIPIEIVAWSKIAILVAACLVLLSGLGAGGYAAERVRAIGLPSAAVLLGSLLAGAIFVPTLLPWLPGRSFATKGAWIGLIGLATLGYFAFGQSGLFPNWAVAVSLLLFIPVVTSFVGMNFTGASTYTSLSGVIKEMSLAVPLQIGFSVVALGLWITGLCL